MIRKKMPRWFKMKIELGMKTPVEKIHRFFTEHVAPIANELDHDPDSLSRTIDKLIDADMMCLRRPSEFGGPEWSESDFREFQFTAARYSGSFAFLQTQHQSAVSLIARSRNESLRQDFLTKMHQRDHLTGIAFGQLRRPGPPVTVAERVDGGYLMSGSLPWATGLGIFPYLLAAATLPDGSAVFGVIPFENRQDSGSIMLSEPMQLAAMQGGQTVSAKLDRWFLPDDLVADIKPADWIRKNDMINIVLQGYFALGCAQAGVDVMADYLHRSAEIESFRDQLQDEIHRCRKTMDRTIAGKEELSTAERHQVRAWSVELAGRCAMAGVVAASGAANSLAHRAQRIYRESIVFAVTAQTPEIMDATLARLCRQD